MRQRVVHLRVHDGKVEPRLVLGKREVLGRAPETVRNLGSNVLAELVSVIMDDAVDAIRRLIPAGCRNHQVASDRAGCQPFVADRVANLVVRRQDAFLARFRSGVALCHAEGTPPLHQSRTLASDRHPDERRGLRSPANILHAVSCARYFNVASALGRERKRAPRLSEVRANRFHLLHGRRGTRRVGIDDVGADEQLVLVIDDGAARLVIDGFDAQLARVHRVDEREPVVSDYSDY